MGEIKTELTKIIDQLAIQVIMTDPENIIGLGEILKLIEDLDSKCNEKKD